MKKVILIALLLSLVFGTLAGFTEAQDCSTGQLLADGPGIPIPLPPEPWPEDPPEPNQDSLIVIA